MSTTDREDIAVEPTAPHVSVVLATRNPRTDWLGAAVESVLGQSYPDLDLVVVDDGSRNPVDVARDRRVRLVRLDDGVGVSAARNVGIASTLGDVVAFIDDDDTWSTQKLERQVRLMAAAPDVVLVATDFDWLDASGERFGSGYPDHWADRDELLQGCGLLLSSVVVRRSALARTGGFDSALRVCEDWDLFLRLTAVGRFDRVREPLTHYRWHDDNGRRVAETAAVSFALLDKYEAVLTSDRDLAGLRAIRDGRRRLRTLFAHQSLARARNARRQDGWRAAAPEAVSTARLDWRVAARAALMSANKVRRGATAT